MADLVFNIERVGLQGVRGQDMHDNRKGGNLDHVNHKNTSLNKVLVGSGNPVKDVEAVCKKQNATHRKDNEKPYTRIVLSASPSHFDDAERGRLFVEKSLKFLEEEYGEGLAYVCLHMDEKTPHLHAVVVPLYKAPNGKVKVSHHKCKATAGYRSYEAMRRRTADTLGLDYGVPGGKAKTEAEAEAKAIIEAAHKEADLIRRRAIRDANSILDVADEVALSNAKLSASNASIAKDLHTTALTLDREGKRLNDRQAQLTASNAIEKVRSVPVFEFTDKELGNSSSNSKQIGKKFQEQR